MAVKRIGNVNINYTVPEAQTQMWDALGRTAGEQQATGSNDNFFTKRAKSIENAIGTTLAVPASLIYDHSENRKTDQLRQDNKNRMNDIAKKYGYNTWNDWQDSFQAAKDAGDTAKVSAMQEQLKEFQDQANANAETAKNKADAYSDYRNNNYISQKINQDRGKFAGSAINTLSTALDLTGLTANPIANAIQGGVEGIADELEQNGLQNFDLGRAGQNALIGAATGAVTGAFNKGVSNQLAKNGGNLFKGGNSLTKGLNNLGSKTAIGRVGSTLATGAARGALSGAVGGATGAGLSSALQGADFGTGISNALQGAVQGAQQGAMTGGIMAGANMAISNTPGVGKFYNELQSTKQRWDQSGSNFDERLTNTLTSGNSTVGDWLMNRRQSKALGSLGSVGNSVRDVSEQSALSKAKEVVKDNKSYNELLRDISNRKDELLKASGTGSNGRNPWSQDLYDFGDIDANILKALQINPELDGASAAAVTQVLRERGLIPDTTVTSAQDAYNKNALSLAEDLVSDNKSYNKLLRDIASRRETLLKTSNTGEYGTNPWSQDLYDFGDIDANVLKTLQINPELDGASAAAVTQVLRERGIIPNNDTPTAVKGWLKKAGERIIEDANNRGVGLSIKDVSNESPETETYRTFSNNTNNQWDSIAQESGYATYNDAVRAFMKTNPNANANASAVLNWLDSNSGNGDSYANTTLEGIFEPESRNQIVNKNKAQALGEQLQNVSKQQKYRALYDSLDSKTAQRAVQTNAPETLADMDVKPENYLEAAKTSNYINKVVSDLADESGVKVNIPDLTNRLEAATEDVILTENAAKKYANAIKQIVADGSTPDEYSAGYLIEKSRELGNKAANLRGNTDDVNTLRAAYNNAKYILRDEAANALANENITGATTNQKIADGLAKMGANKKIVDYYTSPNENGVAPTAKDYIRRSSLFEQARDMGTQVKAEQLTRSASKQPTNWATRLYRATGLDQPLEIILNNTIAPVAGAATKLAGKAIEGVGNVGASIAGNTAANTTTQADVNYNPTTQLYNALGRTEGLTNAEQARTAGYLADAVQNVTKVPNTGVTSLEELVAPVSSGTTSVYNSLYGTESTSPSNSGYFQATGDYWTDILGKAMSAAIDADDVEAFGALYGMYQDALANLQKTSSSETKLTDKQRQANAAALALDDFETAEPNAAYDVSDIPIIGAIANLGGNEYASKAEALALQLGYMLSGATVNREEAKNIGMAYVPQPRDNAAVRQSKLNQIRGIISEYQKTYAD